MARSTAPLCLLRFALVLAALSSLGCWSQTRSLTPGTAREGEVGFGLASHDHVFYAVLAASVTSYTGSANVAMVDDRPEGVPPGGLPRDSVWQSYDGGREIRHCWVLEGGRHVCADAELSNTIGWGKSFVFVDPVNLGRFLVQTQTAASDGRGNGFYAYGWAGGVVDHAEHMRYSLGRGDWDVVAGELRIVQCQVLRGQPRCDAVPGEGSMLFAFPPTVLGVFNQADADVLWIARKDEVLRCTATPAAPVPNCQVATIEGTNQP